MEDGAVILKPLRTYSTSTDAIRAKAEGPRPHPDCVREAIKWAFK